MISVVLAEDMHMVRGALVALLDIEKDIEIVAEIDSGSAILPAVLAHRPDVAVIDIDLPGVDGLTAAAEVHEKLPACRTLILTSLGQPGNLRRALEAHVSGFLLKDAPPSKLADAIRRIRAGERVIDPELALDAWSARENPLTSRETEVLRLAAEGAEAADIAGRLFLSVGTVRNYLTAIVIKLGARNRVDALRIAREQGWL
ncbi:MULTISPECIES: response regulator transcription factor [Streptomyces]|uniref:MerR family transcriptional regulator n=1 Tax=Streptomyces qinglanensis TaxID=943816 RepID=A0A1E7K2S3_9ACTN|nr:MULTISPECIES: response regulator transcription factor [Streptomyces]MBE9499207.1 response regulator transcription factor [Streptomyces sp. GKU 257-1]OEU98231.1 MerR family transcriptional regulator [Streptomyces qinglanensis]OEV09811.1 MerR family transcriptional regulator [Streptomyces nanshensis]OEV25625.1 MerR family transcriptional regulator [Streptomyces nanshensis]